MTLLELQKRMAGAIMAPLTAGDGIALRTEDGRPMRAEAEAIVKPNDRLTSLERLEIYSRSYWFRVIDSLYDDFPGLRAVVGARAFGRLTDAYLRDCPSRSYTMRNLGSRLEGWLREHPDYAGANLELALDMARLEWAHIEAFDGAAANPLGPEDLLELGPGMQFGLQPYLSLLHLRYPVDDLRLRVQEVSEEHEGAASNAVLQRKERGVVRRFKALKPEPIFLAVHRMDFTVYYRRLAEGEFRILEGLCGGMPLAEAVEAALQATALPAEEFQSSVETWFASWSRLGWFCRYPGALGRVKQERNERL